MSKRIRLFVDAHVFDGIPQGTVTFIAGIYSELVKDNRFQIYIGSNEYDKAVQFLNSSNFIHLQYNTHSKYKRLLYTIPKLIREYKIDFAHFQYISPIAKSCQYIVTIHDLLFLEFPQFFPVTYRIKNSLLFRLSAIRADMVTTVSNYSAKTIEKYFRIPTDLISITPNSPFLTSSEHKIQVSELVEKDFILFVSRIEPRKNQALLLKTWKKLKLHNKEIHIVFVGSNGVNDPRFVFEIENLSIEEKKYFHWFENVPTEKLNWLYSNCTLFVFPSEAEGFGIPPLEAAISGAKVLCSNRTAMEDFYFFGSFLFDPTSKVQFKEKLAIALNSSFPHQKVIDTIHSKYEWKKIAKDFATKIIKEKNAK